MRKPYSERMIYRDGPVAIKLRWYAEGPSLIIGMPSLDAAIAMPVTSKAKAQKIIAAMELVISEAKK